MERSESGTRERGSGAWRLAESIFGAGLAAVSLQGGWRGGSFAPGADTGAEAAGPGVLDVDIVPERSGIALRLDWQSDTPLSATGSVFPEGLGVWVNGRPVLREIGGEERADGAGTSDAGDEDAPGGFDLAPAPLAPGGVDGAQLTMRLALDLIPGQLNSVRIALAQPLAGAASASGLKVGNGNSTGDGNGVGAGTANGNAPGGGNGGGTGNNGGGPDRLQIRNDHARTTPHGREEIDVLANDRGPEGSTLTVTHINGIPVSAGDTVTLAGGEQVTLNANGTLSLFNTTNQRSIRFEYTASDGVSSGTASVNVASVPCFVAGTRIRTPSGDAAVETLRPGDPVTTKDGGAQPLRWIGLRRLPAEGGFAPIRIRAQAFGAHGDLWVSPLHRILVRDPLADLLFGEPEVFVTARDLVGTPWVSQHPGGRVTYVHLMFDRHEVLFSEGLETESFLPGTEITNLFAPDDIAEIGRLFPHIDPETGAGYGPAARRTLRRFEAVLLARHLTRRDADGPGRVSRAA